MPRKKQTVQRQKRQKAYREGDFSAAATDIKPKGFFKVFGNYKVFAIIGVVALMGGLALSALYQGGNNTPGGTVRAPDDAIRRNTPEAGETAAPGEANTRKIYSSAPEMVIDTAKNYTATIKTGKGEFTIELLAAEAPVTVNNFVFLAREGFYEGVTFHRVLSDFLVQGGDPTGTGSGGPGYDLPVERTDETFTTGVLGMAKPDEAGAANNGSQFFIVLDDEPTFDDKFTAFGKVTAGLDVVRSLTERDPSQQEGLDPGDAIESITIDEA